LKARAVLKRSHNNRSKIAKASFAIIIIASIAVAFFLRSGGYVSSEAIVGYVNDNRESGTYILLLLYLVSPGLMLPTFYLTLLAGMLWGPFWGVIIDVSGTTCGSLVAFAISRYVAGDFVKSKITNERFKSYLENEDNSSWKLNAMLRLNPIFPSALIGYFFGLTSIKLIEFAASTFVFLIPASAAFISLGSCFTDIFTNTDAKSIMFKVALVAVWVIFWLILRKLSAKVKVDKNGC
jgi:uncharacterized membrane protein YdjX (TVP38/TMEM64 family)